MMKIIIVITSAILLEVLAAGSLLAQQDVVLSGVVSIQNSYRNTGKRKLEPNVSIVARGAIPQVTDTFGRFSLVFPDIPNGTLVRVTINKEGLEVVNKKELSEAAVVGRSQPLKVYMCKAGELNARSVEYYNYSIDAYTKGYREKTVALRREIDQLQKEIQQGLQKEAELKAARNAQTLLEEQYKKALEDANKLAEQFAIVNLDDESDLYATALDTFLHGYVREAITLLEGVNLEKRLAGNTANVVKGERIIRETEQAVEQSKQQIEEDIRAAVLLAKLYATQFEIDKAAGYYELALKYDSLNMDIRWEYAKLMAESNQFEKAILNYDWLLRLTKDSSVRALLLINIGTVQKGQMRTEEAEKSLKKALEAQRELAKKDPENALPVLADVLNNLGVLYLKKKDPVRAEIFLIEALSISREFFAKDSSTYLPQLAQIINNLGVSYKNQASSAKAEQYFTEALNIYRELDKKEPGSYASYIATTLNNLGNLKSYSGDIDQMKNTFGEALEIYRNLARRNPKAYNLDLSLVAYNIGLFYKWKLENQYDESFKEMGISYIQEAENALSVYPESAPVIHEYLAKYRELKVSFQAVTRESVQRNIETRKMEELENEIDLRDANFTDDDYGIAYGVVQAKPVFKDRRKQIPVEGKVAFATQSIPRTIDLIELYLNSQASSKNDPRMREKLADAYNSLAHDYLYVKKFTEAEQAARNGLVYDSTAIMINSNLALSLLFQGNWQETEKFLIQFTNRQPAGKKVIWQELEMLEKCGINHKNVKKAKELINK